MAMYQIGDRAPQAAPGVFVADTARVIGKVRLAAQSSVWFGAVLRGDNEPIEIGERSNGQECAVLHTAPGYPLRIGAGVTVGHQAMLHGCTIGDGSLVGIQAVVLNGATIGRDCLVGAGSLVPEGKSFPDGSLILGTPARVVRELRPEEIEGLRRAAEVYVHKGAEYSRELREVQPPSHP